MLEPLLALVLFLFPQQPGSFSLSLLDSSPFFFLPFAADAAVIIVSAKSPSWPLLTPLMATAGSLVGSALTYRIGRNVGESGLRRLLRPALLEQLIRRARSKGAWATLLTGLMPPPFPFSASVLTAGALKVSRKTLFPSLAAARLLRFAAEAFLALRSGRPLLSWMNSAAVHWIAWSLFLLFCTGLAISFYRILRLSRSRFKSD
ncbi:MAG: VTT domain-containing protein [Acidobacteria bacterium]|nr:VTT domain-containing protein [Acidobacteriota bacterium]